MVARSLVPLGENRLGAERSRFVEGLGHLPQIPGIIAPFLWLRELRSSVRMGSERPPSSKIRWGVLGYGSIAASAGVPAIKWSYNGELLALASRSQETADAKAQEAKAPRAYGSYEALLEDDDVDAVYLALPNGLHETWALRCADAGKHLLCEKTLSTSLASAARVREAFAKRGLRLVEGFMYRHHPQWRVVRSLIADGAIGEVRSIRAALTRMRPAPEDHRWSMQLGGGALRSVTCYGIDAARFLTGCEPIRLCAFSSYDGDGGVDVTTHAVVELNGGVLATASGSIGEAPEQGLWIAGTEGRIVIERPFVPGWDKVHIVHERGADARRLDVKGANHFLLQMEHFARLVLEPERTALPAEDGLANAAALEAIARSAATGRVVELR
jgi:predicted dehydrogenase